MISHKIENYLAGHHVVCSTSGRVPYISSCFVTSRMDTGKVVGTSDKMYILYMASHHEAYTTPPLECSSDVHFQFVLTLQNIFQSPVYSHTQHIRIALCMFVMFITGNKLKLI